MAVDAMGERMVPTVDAMDFRGVTMCVDAALMMELPALATFERPDFTAPDTVESSWPVFEAMLFSGSGIMAAAAVMTICPMLPTVKSPAFTAEAAPESLEEMPSLIPAKALLMPFDALVA